MITKLQDHIILNHRSFIALNKPAAQASVPDQTGDISMLDLAEKYCRKKLFPIHRLDRPVSGIQLFAKSKKIQTEFSLMKKPDVWQKYYLALVKNKPSDLQGRLEHFIKRDGKRHKAIIESQNQNAKPAISNFKFLFSLDHYHVLLIQLHTGRFHQIRAQLAAIGSPIKGDVKYGARRKNHDRGINLHSWKMEFPIGSTAKQIELVAALPDDPIWNAVKAGISNHEING